jgi:hypothetical protein
MGTVEYIDLTLIKNQNKLAEKIANFFTEDEIYFIDISKIEKSNRDLDEIQYIYYSKTFDNNKSIKIIDTLILDSFPATRYVTIRLSIGEKEQLDYRCNYSKNIITLLNILFARVYNYKFWKLKDDDHIIKAHILNNYADILRSKLSGEELEEVKFVLTYLINDGSIKNDNEFYYDFGIGDFEFNMFSNSAGIISFAYKEKEAIRWNKIFFAKTDTGLSNIGLIIQKALNQI